MPTFFTGPAVKVFSVCIVAISSLMLAAPPTTGLSIYDHTMSNFSLRDMLSMIASSISSTKIVPHVTVPDHTGIPPIVNSTPGHNAPDQFPYLTQDQETHISVVGSSKAPVQETWIKAPIAIIPWVPPPSPPPRLRTDLRQLFDRLVTSVLMQLVPWGPDGLVCFVLAMPTLVILLLALICSREIKYRNKMESSQYHQSLLQSYNAGLQEDLCCARASKGKLKSRSLWFEQTSVSLELQTTSLWREVALRRQAHSTKDQSINHLKQAVFDSDQKYVALEASCTTLRANVAGSLRALRKSRQALRLICLGALWLFALFVALLIQVSNELKVVKSELENELKLHITTKAQLVNKHRMHKITKANARSFAFRQACLKFMQAKLKASNVHKDQIINNLHSLVFRQKNALHDLQISLQNSDAKLQLIAGRLNKIRGLLKSERANNEKHQSVADEYAAMKVNYALMCLLVDTLSADQDAALARVSELELDLSDKRQDYELGFEDGRERDEDYICFLEQQLSDKKAILKGRSHYLESEVKASKGRIVELENILASKTLRMQELTDLHKDEIKEKFKWLFKWLSRHRESRLLADVAYTDALGPTTESSNDVVFSAQQESSATQSSSFDEETLPTEESFSPPEITQQVLEDAGPCNQSTSEVRTVEHEDAEKLALSFSSPSTSEEFSDILEFSGESRPLIHDNSSEVREGDAADLTKDELTVVIEPSVSQIVPDTFQEKSDEKLAEHPAFRAGEGWTRSDAADWQAALKEARSAKPKSRPSRSFKKATRKAPVEAEVSGGWTDEENSVVRKSHNASQPRKACKSTNRATRVSGRTQSAKKGLRSSKMPSKKFPSVITARKAIPYSMEIAKMSLADDEDWSEWSDEDDVEGVDLSIEESHIRKSDVRDEPRVDEQVDNGLVTKEQYFVSEAHATEEPEVDEMDVGQELIVGSEPTVHKLGIQELAVEELDVDKPEIDESNVKHQPNIKQEPGVNELDIRAVPDVKDESDAEDEAFIDVPIVERPEINQSNVDMDVEEQQDVKQVLVIEGELHINRSDDDEALGVGEELQVEYPGDKLPDDEQLHDGKPVAMQLDHAQSEKKTSDIKEKYCEETHTATSLPKVDKSFSKINVHFYVFEMSILQAITERQTLVGAAPIFDLSKMSRDVAIEVIDRYATEDEKAHLSRAFSTLLVLPAVDFSLTPAASQTSASVFPLKNIQTTEYKIEATATFGFENTGGPKSLNFAMTPISGVRNVVTDLPLTFPGSQSVAPPAPAIRFSQQIVTNSSYSLPKNGPQAIPTANFGRVIKPLPTRRTKQYQPALSSAVSDQPAAATDSTKTTGSTTISAPDEKSVQKEESGPSGTAESSTAQSNGRPSFSQPAASTKLPKSTGCSETSIQDPKCKQKEESTPSGMPNPSSTPSNGRIIKPLPARRTHKHRSVLDGVVSDQPAAATNRSALTRSIDGGGRQTGLPSVFGSTPHSSVQHENPPVGVLSPANAVALKSLQGSSSLSETIRSGERHVGIAPDDRSLPDNQIGTADLYIDGSGDLLGHDPSDNDLDNPPVNKRFDNAVFAPEHRSTPRRSSALSSAKRVVEDGLDEKGVSKSDTGMTGASIDTVSDLVSPSTSGPLPPTPSTQKAQQDESNSKPVANNTDICEATPFIEDESSIPLANTDDTDVSVTSEEDFDGNGNNLPHISKSRKAQNPDIMDDESVRENRPAPALSSAPQAQQSASTASTMDQRLAAAMNSSPRSVAEGKSLNEEMQDVLDDKERTTAGSRATQNASAPAPGVRLAQSQFAPSAPDTASSAPVPVAQFKGRKP